MQPRSIGPGEGALPPNGLEEWYRGRPGRAVAAAETAALGHILPLLYGHRVVALGVAGTEDLLAGSRIPHRIVVAPVRARNAPRPSLLAEPECLPLASDSVDVVVLPHTLEFAADSAAVLREVERVLVPEGHLVILGFNPLSLLGLWRLGPRRHPAGPWSGRFVTANATRQRLARAGLQTVSVNYCFYRPPIGSPRILSRLDFMERLGARWVPGGGGSYLVLARKRVATLTPIRARWRARSAILPLAPVAAVPRDRHRVARDTVESRPRIVTGGAR